MNVSFITRYLLFLLCGLASWPLMAQYMLKGKVQNKQSEPLVAALVSVSPAADSSRIAQASTTDEKGAFSLELKPATYLLDISYGGKLLYRDSINLKTSIDLDLLTVDDAHAKELDDVIVKGDRPVVRMEAGKLLFTPQVVSAGSVYDILKGVPMVSVVDDAISIIGKGPANIMINGKWQRIDAGQLLLYLKSLPAQSVQRIEVIRNPSAELDAESRNGYINIVLKKNRDKGIMATVSATLSQAKYFSESGDLNLNANTGKWQINATAGMVNNKSWMYGTNDIYFPTQHWREDNTQTGKTQAPSLALGADYTMSKKSSIGASVLWNRSDVANTEANTTKIYNRSADLDSSLLMSGTNPQQMESYSANLNYTYLIDTTGKKIRFDLDRFGNRFDRTQAFRYTNFDALGQQTSISAPFESGNLQYMDITTANLGVELPLKKISLSFGGKLTAIRNTNKTSFYEYDNGNPMPDSARFDHFVYEERTQALYLKASKNIDKWSLMLGLRAENTQTKGRSEAYQQVADNHYLQLFPSADVGYTPNEQHAFSLNYARRIDRPQFGMVNPFRWYHNQYSYTHGNPFLQPYFSHNLDLTYIYRQKWTANLNYYNAAKAFSEIELTLPGTPQRETIVDNFLGYDMLSLNLSLNHNFFDRWLFMPQLSLAHYSIRSSRPEVADSRSFWGYAALYQQFSLNKKKSFLWDVNAYYTLPNNAGVMQVRSTWSLSTGLTFRLLDNKLELSLQANDLFKTGVMRYNSKVNSILRERYVYRDSRYLALTIRYTLNSGKVKKKADAPKANQDEMNRI